MFKIIDIRKNDAAYQTSRSAVKKTQKEKRGMDKIKEISPAIVIQRGFFLNIRNSKTRKKIISWIFILLKILEQENFVRRIY